MLKPAALLSVVVDLFDVLPAMSLEFSGQAVGTGIVPRKEVEKASDGRSLDVVGMRGGGRAPCRGRS